METRKKRRLQLGCLILLLTLLAILFLSYGSQGSVPVMLSLSESRTPPTLYLPENAALPELLLPGGERLKGWENEGTVYYFLPSYAAADRLSLGTGVRWGKDKPDDDAIQYDVTRDILLSPDGETADKSIKICFLHSADLDTIYIDLKDAEANGITKDAFTQAAVKVISPDGHISYHTDASLIKGRGNSTWETDKKPYYLKLPEKAGLCGMEPGKKWILLANAYEATKLTNKLLFDFSKDAGMQYCVDSQWADLYLNGEYQGNYLICEKIDVGEHMVDIADLEEENEKVYGSCTPYADEFQRGFVTDQSPTNISGGYLIEKDMTIADSACGFMTDDQKCFVITSPDNASLDEVAYIRDCFQNIETLLNKHDESLLHYIDADSFARRYLIEELALNSDAFITSCFYYKDRNNDKIYAGPIWDFDSVLGESDTVDYEAKGNVWLNYDETTVLDMNQYRATIAVLDWEDDFQSIPAYLDTVKTVYKELRPQLASLLYEQIDAAAAHVRQSVALDSIRWDYAKNTAGHYASFDNNIRYMKFFLAKRINFLNKRFGMEEFAYTDTLPETRKITCVTEYGEIKLSVEDGFLLKKNMLPEYNEEKYTGWHYAWDRTPISEYLPVYEDMTLYLEPVV